MNNVVVHFTTYDKVYDGEYDFYYNKKINIDIFSETKDGLICALARFFEEYKINRNIDPYCECCYVSNNIEIDRREVIERTLKFKEIDDEILELKNKNYVIFYVSPFSCLSGYTLTDEQLEINRIEKEKFDKNEKEVKEKIKKLEYKKRNLEYEYKYEFFRDEDMDQEENLMEDFLNE